MRRSYIESAKLKPRTGLWYLGLSLRIIFFPVFFVILMTGLAVYSFNNAYPGAEQEKVSDVFRNYFKGELF